MTPKIRSFVQRGDLKGDVQKPWQDKDGFFVASASKFETDYIRVADVESLANAIVAGLRVRMIAEKQASAGLVSPESITIDGLSARTWRPAS